MISCLSGFNLLFIKHRIACPAQGNNAMTLVSLELDILRSLVWRSTNGATAHRMPIVNIMLCVQGPPFVIGTMKILVEYWSVFFL